jgi:cytochrome c oxidase cbb3-type subunit IV
MNAGNLSGIATAVLLAIFIGGWIWAWSGRRRSDFEAAARLPLEDEPLEQRS